MIPCHKQTQIHSLVCAVNVDGAEHSLKQEHINIAMLYINNPRHNVLRYYSIGGQIETCNAFSTLQCDIDNGISANDPVSLFLRKHNILIPILPYIVQFCIKKSKYAIISFIQQSEMV